MKDFFRGTEENGGKKSVVKTKNTWTVHISNKLIISRKTGTKCTFYYNHKDIFEISITRKYKL